MIMADSGNALVRGWAKLAPPSPGKCRTRRRGMSRRASGRQPDVNQECDCDEGVGLLTGFGVEPQWSRARTSLPLPLLNCRKGTRTFFTLARWFSFGKSWPIRYKIARWSSVSHHLDLRTVGGTERRRHVGPGRAEHLRG